MVTLRKISLAFALVAFFALAASAQSTKGTITEVDSDDDAPEKPRLHYYDKHGNKLKEPVLYLAELDTASTVRPQSPYPLWNGLVLGANFGDAVFALTGQKHHSYDLSVAASLHNWFFPIVEAGVGWARHTAADGHEYKIKPAFYAKVGINYNFLYKSTPDYSAFFGLRFGVSTGKSLLPQSSDATGTELWPQSSTADTPTGRELWPQSSMTCTYGEALFGLKVKIAGPFSLGWSVRYKFKFHAGQGESAPWFIPGYGTGPLGFTLNAYWTIGQRPRRDLSLPSLLQESVPDIPSPGQTAPEAHH